MTTSSNKGFSLLELLVVISIFGVLLAFSVPAFRVFSGSHQLKGTTQNIAGTLKLARERAISTGVRQMLHVNTAFGGVNWHIHRTDTNGVVTIVFGDKFPRGITSVTGGGPEFRSDGRADASVLVILRDERDNRDTVSVLSSGLILTK